MKLDISIINIEIPNLSLIINCNLVQRTKNNKRMNLNNNKSSPD